MKLTWNFTLLKLALGSLLAVCFTSGLASAQTDAGKFTLPFETHWGQATLPAGDYSFLLETGPGAKVEIIRAGKPVAFVMEQSYSSGAVGAMSLRVVRTSVGETVREL